MPNAYGTPHHFAKGLSLPDTKREEDQIHHPIDLDQRKKAKSRAVAARKRTRQSRRRNR